MLERPLASERIEESKADSRTELRGVAQRRRLGRAVALWAFDDGLIDVLGRAPDDRTVLRGEVRRFGVLLTACVEALKRADAAGNLILLRSISSERQ